MFGANSVLNVLILQKILEAWKANSYRPTKRFEEQTSGENTYKQKHYGYFDEKINKYIRELLMK